MWTAESDDEDATMSVGDNASAQKASLSQVITELKSVSTTMFNTLQCVTASTDACSPTRHNNHQDNIKLGMTSVDEMLIERSQDRFSLCLSAAAVCTESDDNENSDYQCYHEDTCVTEVSAWRNSWPHRQLQSIHIRTQSIRLPLRISYPARTWFLYLESSKGLLCCFIQCGRQWQAGCTWSYSVKHALLCMLCTCI